MFVGYPHDQSLFELQVLLNLESRATVLHQIMSRYMLSISCTHVIYLYVDCHVRVSSMSRNDDTEDEDMASLC